MTTIIILGAARSGTKFLRELLGAPATATAIDNGINSIWKIGNEDVPHDALQETNATDDVRDAIRKSIFSYAGEETRFLVEKTSANTLRLPFVYSVFPEARYVHLVRDGRAAVESAIRQWGAERRPMSYYLRKFLHLPRDAAYSAARSAIGGVLKPNAKKVWGPIYPGMRSDLEKNDLTTVCARQWNRCVMSCTQSIGSLNPDQFLSVKYEDLLADNETLEKLCMHTGLPVDPVRRRFERSIDRSRLESWRKDLHTNDQHTVEREASEALQFWGYLG